MLNYVWTFLILFGIGTAVFIDLYESSDNKYANKYLFSSQVFVDSTSIDEGGKYSCKIIVDRKSFNNGFQQSLNNDVILFGKINKPKNSKNSKIDILVNLSTPEVLIEMAKANGGDKILVCEFSSNTAMPNNLLTGKIKFEEVSFIQIKSVTNSIIEYAGIAVEIALGLIGIMAMWLGIMKVGETAGLISVIARMLRPVTKFLFPEIPSDHPAVGSMIMNISANMLGLGNAATPFGLKAMQELNELNPKKDTASNSMITFLAINTAGLTLIPASAIAIRAAAGSANPTIIIGTSIFGAMCATIVGVIAAKTFAKLSEGRKNFLKLIKEKVFALTIFSLIFLTFFASLYLGWLKNFFNGINLISTERLINILSLFSTLAIPSIILSFLIFGLFKKVNLYENFIEGAKEGFNIAIKIIPFLVAMLMAIGIFRASGAMDILMIILRPVTNIIGFPVEALPMALMRPLSGSGSLGIMTENLSVFGPDSYLGVLVSTIYGSTETTFYVLAVYFGSVNIKNSRFALAAGLFADIAGILAALFIVKMLFSI